MPNFLDRARELRDVVYAAVLGTEHVLIARHEVYPDPEWGLIDSSIPLALLQVNKQVNAEAMEIFLAQNTFKVSLCPALGRPSVFTTHARLFRNIVLKLAYPAYLLDGEWQFLDKREGGMYEDRDDDGLTGLWKQQMQLLTPMTNLRFFQLDVSSLVQLVHMHNGFHLVGAKKNAVTWNLLRELLTNLPQDIRKKEGLEHRGIWITGIFYNTGRNEMHEMGEACRHFGLNFMTERGLRCAIPPSRKSILHGARLVSNMIGVKKYYYG